jgi:hypothetical protein
MSATVSTRWLVPWKVWMPVAEQGAPRSSRNQSSRWPAASI